MGAVLKNKLFLVCLVVSYLLFTTISSAHAKEEYCYANPIPKSQWNIPDDIYVAKQDASNIIWFGTKSGLFKFDGHNFLQISSAPIDIRDLQFVDQSTLLIASHQSGLVVFDTYKEEITALSNEISSSFSVDGNWSSGVWAGRENAIFQFDGSFNKISNFDNVNAKSIVSNNDVVYFISNKPDTPKGLYKIENKQLSFVKPLDNTKMKASNNKNLLWFSSKKSVNSFNIQEKLWNNHFNDFGLNSMIEHSPSKVWISDYDANLILYDHQLKKKIKTFDLTQLEGVPKLNSKKLELLLKDHENSLWIHDKKNLFRLSCVDYLTVYNAKNNDSLPIRTFQKSKSKEQKLWLGANGNLMFLSENQIKPYPKAAEFLKANHTVYRINKIVEDGNFLWILTSHGLFKLDYIRNEWKKIPFKNYDKTVYRKLCLWNGYLVLLGEGILLIDKDTLESKEMTLYENNKKKNINYTVAMFKVSDSKFLISTLEDIAIIDLKNKTFQTLWHYSEKKSELPGHSIVNAIIETQDGNFIGSFLNGDIIKISRTEKEQFKVDFIKKPDTMPVSRNLALIESSDGAIWQTNRDALYRFNPKTQKFTRFGMSYGIPEQFFYSRSALTLEKHLVFSGHSKVLKLNTKKLQQNKKIPNAIISRFMVNHKTVPFFKTNKIFASSDNHIHVFYGSSNFSHASQTQFQIRFSRKQDWIDYGNRSEAVFGALEHGIYDIQVRARLDDGEWGKPSEALHFEIKTPFWNSWPAILIYVSLTLLLIAAIIKIRERKLEKYTQKLEGDIANRTKEVTELLERKNDLFAHISHELRTPLTLIKNPIKRLRENFSGEDNQLIEIAYLNTERLSKMVNQLLVLAKVNTPELNKREIVNCEEVVKFVTTSISSFADRHSVKLSWDVKSDIHIEQIVDSLETILLNLCVNAIKYSPVDAVVTILTTEKNNNVIIEISDTGPGIPEEFHSVIFERFTRINQTADGVGLGLALVKELVEVNGGKISINKRYKFGTQFQIELPIIKINNKTEVAEHEPSTNIHHEIDHVRIGDYSENKEKVAIKEASCVDKEGSKCLTILIVDDSKQMCNYLASFLSQEFCCIIANDGEEGIAKAKEYCPDVILSDVMMPKVDGLGLLSQLREDIATSHIPVVLLTAVGDENTRSRAYKNLADDFITKPFDDDELIHRIKRLIEIRRLTALSLLAEKNPLKLPISEESQSTLKSKDEEFITRISTFVEENYSDPEFGVAELANQLYVTERTLQRKLKALCGVTPKEYLRVYRIEKARTLIETSHDSIESIAMQVGYINRTHFYRYFKNFTGKTPGEYRKAFIKES